MARNKAFEEQEILEKAILLFWTKGYHATSIDDLTKYLGVSRSSLYDTFGDKKAIFMLALQNYTKNAHKTAFAVANEPISAFEKIHFLVKNIIETFDQDPDRKGCFVINVTTELANQDDEIYEFTKNNLGNVKDIFKNIILQGQNENSISKKHSADDLAYFLFNMYNGLQISGKMGASQNILWRIWNVASDIFGI